MAASWHVMLALQLLLAQLAPILSESHPVLPPYACVPTAKDSIASTIMTKDEEVLECFVTWCRCNLLPLLLPAWPAMYLSVADSYSVRHSAVCWERMLS
jgi:hypothetical protein